MISSLLLLSCGSKEPKHDESINGYVPDTVAVPQEKAVKKADGKGKTEVVKPSSTLSDEASGDDNMRRFDPASEDDMPDNGISRYMENDDDEGWE